MVQRLNRLLITAKEVHSLRVSLRGSTYRSKPSLKTINFKTERVERDSLFQTLYKLWCHSPVSVLSLCLLAGEYQHAYELIQTL